MKAPWIFGGIGVVVVGGLFMYFRGGAAEADDIEYRYSKIQKGELMRSTTASGILVAQTSIDVRSKAGGTIVQLAVDAGSVVKKGDLIAIIDPRDTKALYDQALSDVKSANARIDQSKANYTMQVANSSSSVRDAEIALEQAKIRLEKARISDIRAPISSNAQIDTALAQWESAKQELDRFLKVTSPQRKRDAEGALRQTRASNEAARLDLERQRDLLSKGYVPQSSVDRAIAAFEAASAAFETAKLRRENIDQDLAAEERTLRLSVDRAAAAKDDAKAQGSLVETSKRDLRDAQAAVMAAEVNLQRAKDARLTNQVRAGELSASQSGAVRSRVALDNAKVQLESTTVLAPRDGVVTLKYAEEGTVIPPGVSQFSAGSNIVQLSDVTRLFVDCAVDEADISNVKEGQKTRVVTEAFPGVQIEGVVRRVNPSATTANSITAITVRVELLPKPNQKIRLVPGMNATCEFITLSKPNTLLVPSQAVKSDEGGSYVMVKSADPKKPEKRKVELGESGNDGVELISGLKEGEEVVVAEINLKQLRETQQRMVEAQQGGGLAGGRPNMGGSRATGATGGGGTRPGGMGGGMGSGARPSGGGR
jgi:HlyD family secretion protein